MLAPGLVTTIGSLPHADVDDAVRFVLAGGPELPAAPQLPGRSPLEGMLAQVATAIPGVSVRADGTLTVEPSRSSSTGQSWARPGRRGTGEELDPAAHGGLLAFLRACAREGWPGPVKLQLAGPVTLGLALVGSGAAEGTAFDLAAAAVATTARQVVAAAREHLPGAALTVWLDEPGLVAWPRLPLPDDAVVGRLSRALAALGPGVVTGVHCCGPTEWALAVDAGATVLSMPVVVAGGGSEGSAPVLDRHLRGGGWIAWGAVPTDRPVTAGDEAALWRALLDGWSALAAAGCDPDLLRQRALVTPACGLAGLDPATAGVVVRLAEALGRRVADEARGAP